MAGDGNHIRDLFDRFWEWRLTNHPEYATSIGIHKYDNRLDEISLNAYLRNEVEANMLLKDAKALKDKNEELPSDLKLNLNLLIVELEQLVEGLELKPYLLYVSNLQGPHRFFPRLITLMKRESIDDIDLILSRLRLYPQQIDEAICLLMEGIRLKIVPHEVSITALPDMLVGITKIPVLESSFYKPFVEKPKDINNEIWNNLTSEANKIIESSIYPSYLKLAKFLVDEYIFHTRQSISASSLPNGETFYAACLKFHTTTNLTPREVHNIGLLEVKRINQRMNDVKEEVMFDGTLDEFRSYLRTDEKFSFKSEEEILSYYKKVCKTIEEKLLDYFEVLPKADFEVLPVAPEIAPKYCVANYEAPPNDGSGPGRFNVNTYKPETRKKYDVLALCLHEAMPGHHLQICLTMECGSCPDFRRFTGFKKYSIVPAYFAMNTAYLEGWGLYAEYLGEEMGLYHDPYDLFGRLSSEMMRACRLVVDTGIHAFGWTREQAIQYMMANMASEIQNITKEVDRYIVMPGQACAYKIGEVKIRELRRNAQDKLGNKFDLKSFHHTIVCLGSVPLTVLESAVDIFISEHLNK